MAAAAVFLVQTLVEMVADVAASGSSLFSFSAVAEITVDSLVVMVATTAVITAVAVSGSSLSFSSSVTTAEAILTTMAADVAVAANM